MKKFILILLCLSCTISSYTQNRSLKKKAENAIHNGDIFSAIDFLSEYIDDKPSDIDQTYILAELYFREKNYVKAEDLYLRSFKAEKEKYPDALFKYALCLKIQGKYEKAEKEFKKFDRYKSFITESESKYYKYRLKNELKGIENSKIDELENQILVKNIGKPINNKHIDFNPIILSEKDLIYSTLAVDKVKYYKPFVDSLPHRQFFHAKKMGNTWNIIGEFGNDSINSKEFDTGNGAISPKGDKFYYTRCSKNEDKKIICKLFYSQLIEGKWSSAIQMNEEINHPLYTSTMPAVGVSRQNTDMLYFVSDREEGQGGLDIWYTYFDKKRKTWKNPRNCGKKINSISDEITPFYDVERKILYFSSNGHPNLGGFDIFKSSGSGRAFQKANNIGQPINSTYDDVYYALDKSGAKGFFSSNRPGGQSLRHSTCCDDIYEFIDRNYINICLRGEIYGIEDLDFFNRIREEYEKDQHLDEYKNDSSVNLLNDCTVTLFRIDKNTNEEIFINTFQTEKGQYNFNLEQGYDYTIKVKDFNKDEKTLKISTKDIFQSDTLIADAIFVNTIPTEPIILNNIYYEFDKAELSSEAKEVISNTIYEILKEYTNIIVEISSHTDAIGTDSFNKHLSQARAESVVNYLIELGIPLEQMTAKGYGENKPIAPNLNEDGSDNPTGRAKNRRTEFRVIGELEDYSEIIYLE